MNNLSLIYTRHNDDQPIKEMPTTRITYYDLTIVLKGSLHYTLDGKETPVGAGEALLIKPNTLRQRKECREKLDYISFNFRCDDSINLPTVIEGAVSDDIRLLIAACDSFGGVLANNSEKYGHILCCILLILEDKVRTGSYSPLTKRIIQYIEGNLHKKITLRDVGEATFFSPVYCDTVFKADVGRPITDYIIELRISEAKRLLASEECLALTAIAALVGFDDYNYFCRTFKKRTRYTPTEYRKLISL